MLKTLYHSVPNISQTDQIAWLKLLSDRSLSHYNLTPLVSEIWNKNYETKEHGERMAKLSWQIGKKMGLSQGQLNDLILLAQVHDLGKTSIPDRIMKKTSPLVEEEWAEIKKHPVFGYQMAKLNPSIRHIAEGILCHHERWDGKGYPNGIAGSIIPLSARIITLVDAFDAMTHERIYRSTMTIDEAIMDIELNSGSQFDPDVVNAFVDLMRKPI